VGFRPFNLHLVDLESHRLSGVREHAGIPVLDLVSRGSRKNWIAL